MKVGIAYYPEHEQPGQWDIDYGKLAEAGIRSVRIAEFAWSVLEPSDGLYEWDWLDAAIERAGAHGINVVLCTPTACPPIWLVEKHPDVLPVNKQGRVIGFGARQHRSYSSDHYVLHALRIVNRMAERYGEHPNVVAWQLDNEFGGETKYDFSDGARNAFHEWLGKRYGTVEELNARWGTNFWSQRYERFDQIPLPAPIGADVHMWQHPSLELDFARFSSDSMVRFASLQAAALRPYIGARPITTNAFMFCWGDNLNWTHLFADLDVVGMDIYSNKPHEIAFYADACRGVLGKPFWMMEYGTGTTELKRDMELVRERGCSRFYLFKMKPFPWGQEQGGGQPELVTLTGEPSRNYGVVRSYTAKYANAAEVTEAKRESVGLYYHFDSSWSYQLSVADRIAYPDYIVHHIYRHLFEAGIRSEVVYAPEQLNGLETLIVPLHQIYDSALEERLISFVQDGGRLIITSDLFRKNEDNVYLRVVPRLFAELLDWEENNFPSDVLAEGTVTIRRPKNGKGETWLVHRSTTAEQWKDVLAGFVQI
ncbi:beta-galactosidase [Paenibacillus glycanilyticus]|uniref:beta-galactosidase n=1 Tax=Paenibacillus glycanilyticus TaxID=126569 RepID=A0ABQ6GK13_9BACL|nr:beta-galactosidase [Paenibacillus glycanilyticus]GLX69966.1 beta-galactosidase [Paenibacillus glycanilyticus]